MFMLDKRKIKENEVAAFFFFFGAAGKCNNRSTAIAGGLRGSASPLGYFVRVQPQALLPQPSIPQGFASQVSG